VELETLALDIVNSTTEQNLSLAQSYLFGREYSSMKSILLEGLELLEQQIDMDIEDRKDSSAAMALYAVIFAIAITACSLMLGFGVMRLIRVHSVDEEKMLFKAMVRYYNMRRRQQQNHQPGPAPGGEIKSLKTKSQSNSRSCTRRTIPDSGPAASQEGAKKVYPGEEEGTDVKDSSVEALSRRQKHGNGLIRLDSLNATDEEA